MPELSEVAAYEFGVRLTQSLCLLAQCGAGPNLDAEAALLRLQTACDRFRAHRDETALSRFDERLGSCHDNWLSGARADALEEVAGEIERRLTHAKDYLIAALDQASPAESGWLRLGLLIADGADTTHSPGQPALVPREYPECVADEDRLPYSTLVFVNPVQRRWDWQDEPTVVNLIQELDTNLDQLFKRDRAIRGEESEILRELPSEFWGWHAIEFGLESIGRQRVKPRWDAATHTLYLGHSHIHRYSNSARNQTQILEAFERNAWCNPIKSPFDDAQTANQTVADLDRTVQSAGLHFRGGTLGIRWDFEPVSES
jgi:hypothetical protein